MKIRFLLLTAILLTFAVTGLGQKAASKTEPIQIGATAPDFSLMSNKLEKVTLSEVDKITVLVFYRGYW